MAYNEEGIYKKIVQGNQIEFAQLKVPQVFNTAATPYTVETGLVWCAIQPLEDTVFTELQDGGSAVTNMAGFTLTAGNTIYGQFNALTLTSGRVRCYFANPLT